GARAPGPRWLPHDVAPEREKVEHPEQPRLEVALRRHPSIGAAFDDERADAPEPVPAASFVESQALLKLGDRQCSADERVVHAAFESPDAHPWSDVEQRLSDRRDRDAVNDGGLEPGLAVNRRQLASAAGAWRSHKF